MSHALADMHGEVLEALSAPGAPFEVVEAEINGRPARIYLRAKPDLNAFFAAAEAAHADKLLVAYEDHTWTYGEVFSEARRLAASLASRYGVAKGSRVGLAMRNRPEWFSAFVAVQRLGAIAVLFNSRGKAAELEAAAEQTDCALIIADEARAALFAAAKVSAPVLLVADRPRPDSETFDKLAAPGSPEAPVTAVGPDDPAAILFTSGTTGRAKGAVLTHRNLANMAYNLQFSAVVAMGLAARRMGVEIETLRKNAAPASILLVTPLFHISGVTNFVTACFTGGKLVLVRRWEGAAVLPLLSRHKVTNVSGPTMVLGDLLDQPDAERHLGTITSFVVAGQATPLSLVERVAKALPRASQASGWGSTETSGSMASASGAVLTAFPGSVGRFSPVTQGRVVDVATGAVLPPGEVGEMQVRGALVMKEYWRAPEATEAAFQDGWFKTGDLGYMTAQGFVYLVDRAKDMVISAGENIYCAEVERVLCAQPQFAEAALFGVPDARLGERAVAAVVRKPGETVGEAEVQATVRRELADYKVPSEVVFDISPLPRNTVGKVDKAALRLAYFERLRESA